MLFQQVVWIVCFCIPFTFASCSKKSPPESGSTPAPVASEVAEPQTSDELSVEMDAESKAVASQLEAGVSGAKKDDANRVYDVEELIRLRGQGELDISFSATEEELQKVAMRGVIAKIDAYNFDIVDEIYKPRIQLESGYPETNFSGVKQHLVDCNFKNPEDLDGLKVGQTVELRGGLTWTISFGGPRSFQLVNSQILKTEPHTGLEFEHSVTDLKAWGEDGDKLLALYESLDQLDGVDYFDLDESDLMMDVSVGSGAVDESMHLNKEVVPTLNRVPIIKSLKVGEVFDPLPNSAAVELGAVKSCQELVIRAQMLEASGVHSLLAIPRFTNLTLWEPVKLSAKDLAVLESIPNLRHLKILGKHDEQLWPGEADSGLASLKHCPELRSLQLLHCAITDEGLSFLEQCSQLRDLQLEDTACSGTGLSQLAKPELVWQLSLVGESFDDQIIAPLLACESLIALAVKDAKVTSEIGKCFAHFPGLKTLNLHGTLVDNVIGPELMACEELRSLHLSSTKVDDELVLPIEKLAKLSQVYLSNTQIGAKVCKQLGNLPSVSRLYLWGSAVDDAGLKALGESGCEISRLEVEKTQVTDQGLLELIPLKKLTAVKVSRDLEISDDVQQRLDSEASFKVERGYF